MRVLKLSAENFKRLKAVEIVPNGAVVEVRGRNGVGKSSVLDAIWAALGGADAAPGRPIRSGADKAEITLDLGDLVVTRRFLPSGNSPLIVAAQDGARYPSPQAVLDRLIGKISFDPLEFTRMKPRDQLDTLRGLVNLDVDLDALDLQRAAFYGQRTDANREAKQLRGQAAGVIVPAGLPAERVDTAALAAEVERAGEHNRNVERQRGARSAARTKIESTEASIAALRDRRRKLLQEARLLYQQIKGAETRQRELEAGFADLPPLAEPIDTSAIVARVREAEGINAGIVERERRAALEDAATIAEQRSDQLGEAIEAVDAEKARAIERANLPVAGLGFGDGGVLFNGVPFEQASQAEKIRVSVAIAMSANPELRVLCVRDGSLLDDDSLRLLTELVTERDYQLWLERVGDEAAETGVVIEDGAVRGALPLAMEAAE
jgi:hypothetical protein